MATLRRFGPPAAALVIGLTACGSPQAPEAPPQPVPVAHDVRADIASLAAADGTFGADLLASPELPRTGNIAISPVSVGLVLQMVATGAAGQTGTQLARVLHLPNASAAATAAGDLLRDLATTQQDGHNKLRLANSVWTQDNLAVTPAFADAMKTRFGASANQADFAHQPDQARDRINKTIADQTEGKIPQLFPSGSLDETTRLVLTNAIYLEASWAKEFSPDRTTPAPFH